MPQNWTARVSHSAQRLGRVFRTSPRGHYPAGLDQDADSRRIRTELDAIRARFPDHA